MKNKINTEAKFFKDLVDPTQVINVNGNDMSRAYWNLIISIRDCGLYSKGIKPHRHWKISDVKTYFGITGGAESLYHQLQAIKEWCVSND